MNPVLLLTLALATALAAGGRLLVWQQAQPQDTGSVLALLLGDIQIAGLFLQAGKVAQDLAAGGHVGGGLAGFLPEPFLEREFQNGAGAGDITAVLRVEAT